MTHAQLVASTRLVLDANTHTTGRAALSAQQLQELLRNENTVPSLRKLERALVVLAVKGHAQDVPQPGNAAPRWHITLKGHEASSI
jgi:hypothetical protein